MLLKLSYNVCNRSRRFISSTSRCNSRAQRLCITLKTIKPSLARATEPSYRLNYAQAFENVLCISNAQSEKEALRTSSHPGAGWLVGLLVCCMCSLPTPTAMRILRIEKQKNDHTKTHSQHGTRLNANLLWLCLWGQCAPGLPTASMSILMCTSLL